MFQYVKQLNDILYQAELLFGSTSAKYRYVRHIYDLISPTPASVRYLRQVVKNIKNEE
jgi:hypothetical protein